MTRQPEVTLIQAVQHYDAERMVAASKAERTEVCEEALIESRLLAVDSLTAPEKEGDGSRLRMAMLEAALRFLDSDSSLVLSLMNHDEEKRQSAVRFKVGVVCRAGSAEDAENGAHRSLGEVLPFLGRQLGYRFSQEDAHAIEGVMAYKNDYELGGVLVASRAVTGVDAGTDSRLPILLSRPGRYHPLRSAWSVLARSQRPVTLELRLQSIQLKDEQLAVLEHTVNLLQRGKGGLFEYPSRRLLTPGEADAHYYSVKTRLDQWLRYPRGVRLTARLYSAAPLPGALVLAVGASLYPGRHILLTEGETTLPEALDLRECFNESIQLPDLLPGPTDLTEADIPCHPAPRIRLPQKGTLLGTAADQNVRLDPQARLRHVFVLGATGSGKSTLLLNMIRQDMLTGEGLCLIDPNGDLYEDVLRHVPPARAAEVIQLDAGNFDRAFGLNFLEVGGAHPEVMASQNANAMLRIMDHLYDLRVTGGPMFEMYMRSALLLAMRSRLPGLTLVEVARVFEDTNFRKYLLRSCTDPETVRFWKQVAEPADGESRLANMAPYVVSKLNQMTHNDLIRPIIGQSRSTVVFRELMDKGRILLVNLSKGRVGDMDSRFLGTMLLSKLSAAALARADVGREARRPFHVYVDEYHNYAGEENLSLLLAEGRKYGIGLTLATQHLRQLSQGHGAAEALSAVLGNAGTHVYFRTGPMDAETLGPFLGTDIPERQMPYLPDFTAVVRVMAQGRPLQPFVMNTGAPPMPEGHARVARLASKRMREEYLRYTRPLGEVQEEIEQRGVILDPSQLAAMRQNTDGSHADR